MGRVRVAVLAISVAIISYFCVSLVQVWNAGRDEAFERSSEVVDAIVVLGAAQYDGRPSPQLRSRLDHVMVLWNRGAAPLVVVTGGKQSGDRFTEAGTSRDYLVSQGIPPEAIVVESRSASTFQALETVHNVSRDDGWNQVVLVSDPYHVKRAQLVARELGLRAEISATRTSVTTGSLALRRNVREAVGIMFGRVVGFRRLEAWLQ